MKWHDMTVGCGLTKAQVSMFVPDRASKTFSDQGLLNAYTSCPYDIHNISE
ncbi:MAG: hypothetical protein V1792_17650 [Pseudomonadota bacterium]